MKFIKDRIKTVLRNNGYAIVPSHQISIDTRQIQTLLYFGRIYDRIRDIPGSLVECGVGRGRTFLYLSYFASIDKRKRMLWGFDSFVGFPEPDLEDITKERAPKKGEWSGTSEKDILSILHCAGIQKDFIAHSVKLVQGFVEDTLIQYNGGPIALLHIDLDLYTAYKSTLHALFSQVVENGIVLFDEYNDLHWPGAKKAVDEFFLHTGYHIEHDEEAKKFFVVKKKNRPM